MRDLYERATDVEACGVVWRETMVERAVAWMDSRGTAAGMEEVAEVYAGRIRFPTAVLEAA